MCSRGLIRLAILLFQLLFVARAAYAPIDPSRILEILGQMTLREKLEETGITNFVETDWDKLNPYSVWKLLPTPNAEHWFDLKENVRLQLRGIRTRDGPRGITCLLGGNLPFGHPCPKDGATPGFPAQNLRAMTWDIAIEEEFGAATGEIAKLLDIHAALLPCINIVPWLNAGRGQESYGEDPLLSGKMGAAVVRGIQSKGVMATVKHFLANNIENSRWHVSAEMDDKTLHEVYLKQWAIVVAESSPEFIMTSYNRVQGNWSNVNPKFISLLREKLGFEGSIMTDWLALMKLMPSLAPGTPFTMDMEYFGQFSSALEAGVDMEMPFNSRHTQAVRELASCKRSDLEMCSTANKLDSSVARLLRSKFRYGLVGSQRPSIKTPQYNLAKYNELSLRISRRGVTLLRNEDSFLPKRPEDVSSVVVLGSAHLLELGDHGSSAQNPAGGIITVIEGLEKVYGRDKVSFIEASEARSPAVRNADMVVLDVGTNFTFEGEYIPLPTGSTGGDRVYLSLHSHELALIKDVASVNPNVVVAMTSGQVIIVEEFVNSVRAILWLGYPGPFGGQALAEILAGEVNPSGRMTSATPRSAADWVPQGITLEPWKSPEVQYPYSHGFKHMWASGLAPRYPIGWGLSYTTFTHGEPRLSTGSSKLDIELNVTVSNAGQRAGIETVQVYVICPSCQQKRQPILLVGFASVKLDAGTSEDVLIRVSAKDFAVYDAGKGHWSLEKATYKLLVGPNGRAESLRQVDYMLAEDTTFDYPGVAASPNVPGAGDLDCSTFRCTENVDFNLEELQATVAARALQLITLCPFLFLCMRCWRRQPSKLKKS